MNLSCQPLEENLFSAENIRNCEAYVLRMQRRLDKAVANKDQERIRFITHLLSKRSKAVKIMSINKVTRLNGGKYTAGIDRVKTPKDPIKANKMRNELLYQIDVKEKPQGIRRILIPKSNGKMRPLGISTLKDRVIQEIIRMSIEPICEYHFSDHSYGFRPKRSCHDAIQHLYLSLSLPKRKTRWIVEGDISSCFDHISHTHIIKTMRRWGIPFSIIQIVTRMLKAKIMCSETIQDSFEGTPQGSILSPMLSNIALTTLDQFGETVLRKRTANPIIRYADDFVCLCDTKAEAIETKEKIKRLLKDEIGVELSTEKTHITHVNDGFNFLGFKVRKYTTKNPKNKYHQIGKLLITPQKEKVDDFLYECKQVIKSARGQNLQFLLQKLNPRISGFANYYRFVVSQKTFSRISTDIWFKVYRWLLKSHPNKGKRWVYKRYTAPHSEYQETKTFWHNGIRMLRMDFVPIKRFTMVKKGSRIYDNSETIKEYWRKRADQNSLNSIYSVKLEKLFQRQMGYCPICRKLITGEQIRNNDIQTHHISPQSTTADLRLSDLRLIHCSCHIELHRILSVEEMQTLAEKKIDYCSQEYLYTSFNDSES